ncbi:MAG: hypothetical protein PG981_001235 [Wolbachia endosymbiont of Ctenocephalides orientis wCori]|nr:MAG: hypothetical protein PG981_001235 [Wolbachia endosymbiont of Ctenocephalides orientis wCori]
MANDNFKSLEDLITEIKQGSYDNIKAALCEKKSNQDSGSQTANDTTTISVTDENKNSTICLSREDKTTLLHTALKKNYPNLEIIELLLNNGADLDVEDINGENALCLAIKNRNLKEIFTQAQQENNYELLEKLDFSYRYSGPLNDKTKRVNINGDNFLHIAARARNVYAFLLILKKSIEDYIPLLEYNEDHENPLHVAARMGILKVVVREMLSYLESTANDEIKKLEVHIKKAREDGNNEDIKTNQKKIKEIKGKLESNKNYIKNALNSKYALNKDKRTPLDWVSKDVKNEIKEAVDIKDSFLCNKKFHLTLQIGCAIACIAALCISLYLLYLSSQAFALSSLATMAFGGATYFAAKACIGLHDLHNENASMEGIIVEGSTSLGLA